MIKRNFILVVAVVFTLFVSANLAWGQTCQSAQLTTVKFGQRGERIKNLQACLVQAGYRLPDGATGYYGSQTAKAVAQLYRDWQKQSNLSGRSIGPSGLSFLKKLVKSMTAFSQAKDFKLQQFTSASEFRLYLSKAGTQQNQFGLESFGLERAVMDSAAPSPMVSKSTAEAAPGRVSETTVQVKGIDEPDIVKTDGQNIYYSREGFGYVKGSEKEEVFMEGPVDLLTGEPLKSTRLLPPIPRELAEINMIRAFPVEGLNLVGKIDKNGELLLLKDKKILVVFSGEEIIGYDIADAKNPKKKWSIKLEDNTSLVTARLYQDKIYLVTQNYIDTFEPCPIRPLSVNSAPLTIICPAIYYPTKVIPIDVTFTALQIEPDSGTVAKSVSFVGASADSVVYMSPQAIYVTYFYQESYARLMTNFLKEKGVGLLPEMILTKIEKLNSYDISEVAKQTEIQVLISQYQNSLKKDERLRFEQDLNNRLTAYYKEHKRELEQTGIVKIEQDNLTLSATGALPGYLLNQFVLDEYGNNLRLAVTVGERGFALGRVESANDVYVLDKDLKISGQVLDLGTTERIYSVRFIGDKGYVVTFRQTDPFYVLDLADPTKPELKGELKIPGYSAYLEPITENLILGVGQEQGQVKVSLFDVSLASRPVELDKYLLKDYWSEVLNNHHAFLLDSKHQIFFLPGGQGGYIFSYKNNKLELIKAISDVAVKRAVYIDDYLYILSQNKIVVFDENNWEKVKELELN